LHQEWTKSPLEIPKPIQVLRAIYYYLHFNEKGILDYDRFMKDGGIVASAGNSAINTEKVQGNIINIRNPHFVFKTSPGSFWMKGLDLYYEK